MANEVVASQSSSSGWQAKQVYALAVVCLVIGLAVGYLFRGSRSPAPTAPVNAMQTAAGPGASPHAAMGGQGGQPPTLEQMKQMADKKAEPLLAKLKDDPKNAKHRRVVGSESRQFPEYAMARKTCSGLNTLSRVGLCVHGNEMLNSEMLNSSYVRKLQVHCGVVKRRGFPSASGHGACGSTAATGATAHVNTSHPCKRFLG